MSIECLLVITDQPTDKLSTPLWRWDWRHKHFTMSALASPASSPPRKEPDLFFPVSDSEEEDVIALARPTSSTVIRSPGAPSKSPTRNGGRSSPFKNGSTPTNVDTNLPASQDGNIIPLDSTLQPTASTSKLRRPSLSRSPSSHISPGFTVGYLGEFVCEGWSLSKGKGYCVPGSKVIFERPKAAKGLEYDTKVLARSKEKVGPARLVNGKVVNGKAKVVGGKQVTLGAFALVQKAGSGVRIYVTATKAEGEVDVSVQTGKKPPGKPVVDQIIRFRWVMHSLL